LTTVDEIVFKEKKKSQGTIRLLYSSTCPAWLESPKTAEPKALLNPSGPGAYWWEHQLPIPTAISTPVTKHFSAGKA
jgi:hypothetical protein